MPVQSEPSTAPAVITFARELEAWRTQAGLNKRELAKDLGYTDSYVGQIELCKNTPSQEFADDCDTFFKTNGLFRRLRERILDTRHLAALPPGFAQYLGHEATAVSIKNFSPILVPGLLQTEDYGRAVLSANQRPELTEQLLEERLNRRNILATAQAYFTVDEAVLHRVVGNPEIMCAQLEHILELAGRPTISIDVVPSSVGFYRGLSGMLILLGMEDGRSLAYTEASEEGILIVDPARVARHALLYDSVRGHALSVHESPVLIKRAIERLRGCQT
ncbi:Scr1 family TA system antitoxin-like transcriptional regulator [Spirillospora sp. NPDC047279]|uniref:Scr1 family TA system antitoxin-like transcriptional regulator n=1 Tax=Spirillospora sp. NPDC047279 TaxID=3155478 RepID=UPI0033D8BC6E